jgi:hypothetical protein
VIWDAAFICRDYPDVSDVSVAEHLTYNPSTLQWNLKIRKSTSDMKSNVSTPGTTIQDSENNNNDETLYVCDLEFRTLGTKLPHRWSCLKGVTVVSRCPDEWKDTEVITQFEAYTAHVCVNLQQKIYRNHH